MLTLLKNASQDNPELLKLFIDIQYQAAQIDGLTATKIQLMNLILNYLGFAPLQQQYRFYEDFNHRTNYQRSNQSSYRQQQYTHTAKNTLEHAYAILEINSTANKQEVKRAYRRLMSRNHPDKLIAKGLPEEMIKMANDKTQKIRKAYEQICASKGWN
ncbi:DnaJ-domain-containing protein 1 [Legionella oakridgensis ATCC 33761 = DSM 21215]|uniref:DnaJ-domain-containing protein 1 n=2 Tax=Legionella oakridgensis TaxID=29423 RepID=W0B761_9GAMM|nr:DnaJ-domain-containing protein 1 [Legionella oakridgensis ATCC 33761 = DSM 21215]